ncbi:hypothetical protein FRB97_006733 [Tulasnella sp. 331]|nr:hypothetical protein FRB97_006733 [Tulasnella sp. 331]
MSGILLSTAGANLMGFLVSMLMYGFYVGMFAGTIQKQWERRKVAPVVCWVTIALFIITTVNTSFHIVDASNAWVNYPGGPNAYFSSSSPLFALKDFFLATASILADILLCWRLRIIWARRRFVVIIAVFLLCAQATFEIIFIAMSFAWVHPPPLAIYYLAAGCGVITNIFCTSMIAGRLWYVGRRTEALADTKIYKTIILSLVESGALYTGTLLLWIAFTIAPGGHNVFDMLTYIVTMVIPTASILLVFQITEARSSQDESESTSIPIHRISNYTDPSRKPKSLASKRSDGRARGDATSVAKVVISVQSETYRSSHPAPEEIKTHPFARSRNPAIMPEKEKENGGKAFQIERIVGRNSPGDVEKDFELGDKGNDDSSLSMDWLATNELQEE